MQSQQCCTPRTSNNNRFCPREDGDNHNHSSATMETASAGLASSVSGSSSSFRQFRITQFVENAPKPPNAITDPLPLRLTPAGTSNRDSVPEQMAQSSRPSSGQIIDGAPSAAPARTTTVQENNQTGTAGDGGFDLALAELASNPLVEGILGPNKDGRVRNPVPSKLKGKTDQKQGNFGVMHMGMSPGKKTEAQGRDAAAERDAAARRTSENTASRAKAAQSGKYVPPNKRGLDGGDRASPFATDKQRKRPLAPDETKTEQARLLTLLRCLSPVTVVDQICKAVAYFGGIPLAPPPEDGIFPESANTGETGALFIGWLSEIFPDLMSPEVPQMQAPPSGGKKKGKAVAAKAKIEVPPNDAPNPRNGFGFGQAVSAPAWGLPQSLSLVNTLGVDPTSAPAPVSSAETNNQAAQQPHATPTKQQSEDNHANSAPGVKRGRGRPKGSTNKSRKSGAQGSMDATGSTEVGVQKTAGQQVPQSPQMQAPGLNNAEQRQETYTQPSSNQTGVTAQPLDLQYPAQPWQTNATKIHNGTSSKAVPEELSPEELAVLNAFRNPAGPSANSVTPNAASAQLPQQNSTGKEGGAKRKRAPPKPKQPPAAPQHDAGAAQQSAQAVHAVQHTPILPPSKDKLMGGSNDALQWTPGDTSTPTAPHAKRPRQRKPKAPNLNDPSSHQKTASVVSQPTPPMMPSTIPDSQGTSSQQSVAVTRAPAEGLEAHYERFTNTSVPQQDVRSHTPSMTSIASITPQQHIRQLQKPSSVLPQSQQQSSAQTHTQLQMQRQKSQQGTREDQQKLSQAAAGRSSSTGGFYTQQQQRQSTYGTQQYPSHQPSQLANAYSTHTASPQLSNNSYRNNSSHSIAQASPQFSQADSNTYRAASPHTIAQPSPSFTQPETNFRASSTHSITHPSATYSQAENTYRTASSLTGSTPSYTRTPHTQTQSSHQSHYGHYPEASYVDLPTLESLGHSGSSASNTMSAGGYGQQALGVGLGASSTSRSGTHSIYGTSSSLGNAFDTSATDLLRGVSRGASSSAYSTTSGLGGFDTEAEMRERLMRGIGGRR